MTPQPSRAETTVVVIDDPTLLAESLHTALQLEGYDARWVAAEPSSLTGGFEVPRIDGRAPRIAVLDLDLGPDRDATQMIRQLSEAGTDVVVLTASDDVGAWAQSLEAGAVRVLPKTLPLPGVLAVVRRLHDGLPVMSEAERTTLVHTWRRAEEIRGEASLRFARLTSTEQWVLARLMEGQMTEDIADQGQMTPTAARSQVRSMLDKLQVVTWLDAVSLATESGWSPDHGGA